MWRLISGPRRLRSSEILQRRIERPFGLAQQLDQPVPLALFQRQQLDIAIGAREHTAIAERAFDPVLDRAVAEALDGESADREHRVLAGNVDILPADLPAHPQRCQRAQRGGDAALHLGEMAVDLHRRAVGEQLAERPLGSR